MGKAMGKKWIGLTLFILIAYSYYSGTLIGLKGQMSKLPMLDIMKKMTINDYFDHPSQGVSPSSSQSFSAAISQNSSSSYRKPSSREDRKVEQGLAAAREAIRKVSINNNSIFSKIYIYHNPGAFYQSYAEMEKRLKVYVYKEGELPVVHDGPNKNLYTSEGRFIHEIEHGKNKFRTKDPYAAQLYFMPFSVTMMVKYLYEGLNDVTPLQEFVSEYVRVISTKHPFWNRSSGADHFMVACHDWGPDTSKGHPIIYNTSIRVLCNANSSEGFNPQKDVSLPQTTLMLGDIPDKLRSVPPANLSRPYLAFFAGGSHGGIREFLIKNWKGRDTDIRVYEYLPKNLDYDSFLLQSKFCLCPSGFEVSTPRIVESIYANCVPVIISDYYVLPLSDVLNWKAFSIKVEVADIPRLKELLMAVPEEKYLRLKDNLRAVRKHFIWNEPPQKFDVFHMILHSVWLRRLNFKLG